MSSSSPAPGIPSHVRAGCLGALVAGCVLPLLWTFRSTTASDWVQVLFSLVIALGGLYWAWWSYGSHRSFMLPAGALPLAPFIFLFAQSDLDVTLIDKPFSGRFGDWLTFPPLVAIVVVTFVLTGTAGALVARWLVRLERRWLMRVLHAASLVALACAGALIAGFLPRAVRFPAPAHYVESLPTLGVVPCPHAEPARTVVVTLPRRTASTLSGSFHRKFTEVNVAVRVYESVVADFEVRRFCPIPGDVPSSAAASENPPSVVAGEPEEHVWRDPGGCWVHLSPAAEPFDERAHMDAYLRKRQWNPFPFLQPSDDPLFDDDSEIPLILREDTAHALLIFDGKTRHAMRREPLKLTEVQLRDVADSTSPPRGWMAASAVGILVAGWIQIRRRRALRRLDDRLARARAGDTLPGDRSEILARERMAWMPCDAQALAIVLLAAAPLAAAAQFWLLR